MCFNVSILDDDIEESEEYFLVMITSGDPQVKLSPSTTALTILDDDAVEPPTCPVGRIFLECGSACPPSCDLSPNPCIFQCVKGIESPVSNHYLGTTIILTSYYCNIKVAIKMSMYILYRNIGVTPT